MARSADNSKRMVSAVAATVVALAAGTNVRLPGLAFRGMHLICSCVLAKEWVV